VETIISAIVCTRNRGQLVEKAAASLLEQTLDKNLYEILIVDNNSSDDTKKIIKKLARNHKNLSYVFEPTLGIAAARNKGWPMAKGKYIAWLDDDAIASPNWLEMIVKRFDSLDETVGDVGGKIDPIWDVTPPSWLTPGMKRSLTILDWSDDPHVLKENEWLAAANIAHRKSMLERLQGFNPNLGRKGDVLLCSLENYIGMQMKKLGFKSFYDPAIHVWHFIPRERLQKEWFYKRSYWQGVSEAIIKIDIDQMSEEDRLNAAANFASKDLNPNGWLNHMLNETSEAPDVERKIWAFKKSGYMYGLLKGKGAGAHGTKIS
jgi:glycosyltransferase involved in cell wall biosynthesis